MVNRRAIREAIIPAAGISCTARDLARFYASLLVPSPVFAASTLDAARAPSTAPGELDRFLRLPVRWSYGFQLGGPDSTPMAPSTLDRSPTPCCQRYSRTQSMCSVTVSGVLPFGGGTQSGASSGPGSCWIARCIGWSGIPGCAREVELS